MAIDPDPARDVVVPGLLGDGAECAEIGISIYADDGKCVAVNQHACKLLGYARDELVAHDVADFTEGASTGAPSTTPAAGKPALVS
jgi:PAS domain-containing protein